MSVLNPRPEKIYQHEDLGRVRVKKLPRNRPRGVLVTILSSDSDATKLVEVEREKLSEFDPSWSEEPSYDPNEHNRID